jgi:hypothetical protein
MIHITNCKRLLPALVLLASLAAYPQDPDAEDQDYFGSVLARGDFNGDGFEDLAVGIPQEDIANGPAWEHQPPIEPAQRLSSIVNAGAVEVIYGTGAGLAHANRQFWRPGINNLQGAPQASEAFGSALAAGDFDGDGIADLAIGAPASSAGGTNAGAVYVLYGSTAGLIARTDRRQIWSQQITVLGGVAESGDRFGASLAAGDFDGNGYIDLAVGVPGEGILSVTSVGAINLIYGSRKGLSETATAARKSFFTQKICTIDSCVGVGDAIEENDNFGHSLAAGDFNGDHVADLAVGVPYESVGTVARAGAVNVIYGSALGLIEKGNQVWHQDSPGILDQCELQDLFGWSLAAGDFNLDLLTDLSIGVPGEGFPGRTIGIPEAGAVNVIHGSSTGLRANGNQFWHQGSPGLPDEPEPFDRFGWSLATGDFNADGADDLAIGVPFEDLGAAWDTGAVQVLYGMPGGALSGLVVTGNQFWHQDSPNVENNNEIADRFGLALTAGRFNGAEYSSLAIGVPWETLYSGTRGNIFNAGAVGVIYGSDPPVVLAPGLNATDPVPNQMWTQTIIHVQP